MDILRGNSSSMGSSTSHLPHLCSLVLSFSLGPGWSLRASRLLLTRLVEQYRIECGRNLVEAQMNGEHNVADCGLCRFRHRGESKPMPVSQVLLEHCSMLTLIAPCSDRATSLSDSRRGLLPKISGSQNCPTAPLMCWIFPCVGEAALTHCDGSRPTPQTR